MAQTTHFNLEKPDNTKDVDEEFIQLQTTFDQLDSILKTFQDGISGKASASHGHAIADIVGLTTQLAAKMPAGQTFKLDDLTDVSGADAAANGYLLVKSVLGWVPSSPTAALGTHGHTIAQITGLADELDQKADADDVATVLAFKADASALANKADQATTYTKTETDAAIAAAGVPIGVSILWNSTAVPTGFLKENGAAISRTTYAALFAIIGTTFGVGDGSTTFNLPDSRGEFFRGLDDGRGVDSGRALGTAQGDEFKSHTHTTGIQMLTSKEGFGGGNGAFPGTVATSATGGSETRPRNVTKLALIRAY